MSRAAAIVTPLAAMLLFTGCAPVGQPTIRLALDGPPLRIVAEGDTQTFAGGMDRDCMAGLGGMIVYNRRADVSCQGRMDRPATDKGRLYISLECSNGDILTFVMRNLGPDQGMGLGRVNETGEQLLLFYHPCEDEARRRLEQLKADIAVAKEEKRKRETAREEPE